MLRLVIGPAKVAIVRVGRKSGGDPAYVNAPVTIYPADFAWEGIHIPPPSGTALDASAAPLLLAGGPLAAAQSFETRERRQGRSTGMTETTAAQDGAASAALSWLADLGTMLPRSDIALAVGMIAILVVLILPLPSLLLDFPSPSRSRSPC
jgi:hypothetical protein